MSAKLIDIDPELLRQKGEAAVHAAEQTRIHLAAEMTGQVPKVMDSLVKEGPLTYTTSRGFDSESDAGPGLEVSTTRDAVREYYTAVHRETRTYSFLSLVEICGEWYTFHEGIANVWFKATGETVDTTTLLLFPSGAGEGVTGELVWQRDFAADADGSRVNLLASDQVRRQEVLQHDRYLQALKSGDLEEVIDIFSADIQGAIRDYANDPGELIKVDGRQALRELYQSLFEKYDVQSADAICRVAQDSYVFAETRVTAKALKGPEAGKTVAFHTADWFVPGSDGRFLARVGYGTDPA